MLRHFSRNVFFSNFWFKQYFWKFWPTRDKKTNKSNFLAKNHIFWLFRSKFSKILPNSKIWRKKTFLELCLNMIFNNFSILTQNYLFSLSQKCLTKKVIFCHFLKKSALLEKNWYLKWILWLISIPEMYTFIYITVIVWKLQHSICFKKNWVHTPLK